MAKYFEIIKNGSEKVTMSGFFVKQCFLAERKEVEISIVELIS